MKQYTITVTIALEGIEQQATISDVFYAFDDTTPNRVVNVLLSAIKNQTSNLIADVQQLRLAIPSTAKIVEFTEYCPHCFDHGAEKDCPVCSGTQLITRSEPDQPGAAGE